MLIDVGNHKAWLIGDPHMGRDFRNGTPLHRRGEREAMQLEQFRQELRTPEARYIIMVGDLFDKPFLPLPVVHAVAQEVRKVALSSDKHFVFMAGNHDKSRQLNISAAWELFELAVGWLDNVHIVNDPTAYCGMMLYPWQWGVSAVEQVERFGSRSCDVAIGHWDLQSFGGDDSHMCPAKMLRDLNPNVRIYSGHYHEEGPYEIDGITVECAGSMQPYTHGEDSKGEMYLTLTREEALARAEELKDKCVRIVLEPGEDLPDIDCLQLTKMRGDVEAVEIEEVGLGGFDVATTLDAEFEANEVPDFARHYIKEKIGAVA